MGVAVSGGGDSISLLHLMARLGPVQAVTVNHGLRSEAAEEAAFVVRTCADLGVPHDTLQWSWDGQGNLQARARQARFQLIADWAQARGLTHVALGHTLDDQAETVLMRLAREAGVDGLSAMTDKAPSLGVTWVRPLLAQRRDSLRAWLRDQGIKWIEDPSNDDLRFDRVKARQALALLEPLGITSNGLANVATQMRDARRALNHTTARIARAHARVHGGDIVFNTQSLSEQPAEIYRRFLLAAIRWVSSTDYAPRRAAIARLQCDIAAGRPATIHGCIVLGGVETRITRELRAVAETKVPLGSVWDGRWQAVGPAAEGLVLMPLGAEGQLRVPELREMGLPHASRLSLPGLWRKGRLVAAPFADLGEKWRVNLVKEPDSFIHSLESH